MSIYNENQRLQGMKKRWRNSSFSDEETKAVFEWGEHRMASGNSPLTVAKYLYCLQILETVDVDLEDPCEKGLKRAVRKLQTGELGDYSVETKSQVKIALKNFVEYSVENGEELVDWVDTTVKKSEKRVWKRSDFVEEEDVPKLLDACDNARDHLLIKVLWLSGGRIGEVLSLDWKDVTRSGDLVKVRFRESKSEPRVVSCPGDLWECVERWKKWHPDVGPGNPVFVSFNSGDRMGHGTVSKVVKRLDNRSGVGKGLSPHDFRRGRATFLASEGWNQARLMKFFGWSDAETPQRYIWLADSDLEEAVKELPT